MRAVWSWLRELSSLPADTGPEEAAAALTGAGLEVEAIERCGEDFSGVVVAEVAGARPHPRADSLTLVDVRRAPGGETSEVVCGAANVPAPGGRVLWAVPGAVLPGGVEIGARAIVGVTSAGMLCSEDELGIGDDADGIVVLDDPAAQREDALGAQAQAALGLPDVVFDVSAPPNRGDALGHYGLARELAARLGGSLRRARADLADALSESPAAEAVEVDIEDPEGCPRYVARAIEGVRWGSSPAWMRTRLRLAGARPLGNLIDVTNYVMFELGQPLHAFDADKLDGGITVRKARRGERITTLDGAERELEEGDLAICDRSGPIALAGVMGGARTEVGPETSRIVLESAHFAPERIRRTARRVGLHSESSHRFERGVDPNGADQASARAARLFADTAGGRVRKGAVDAYARPAGARVVTLRAHRARMLTGVDLDVDTMASHLAVLDLPAEKRGDDALDVSCPTFRFDLEREVDLIEEVLRLHGFDAVPTTLPAAQTPPNLPRDPRPREARAALVGAGFAEAITFGFTSRERIAALALPESDPRASPLALRNPMTAEQAVMRTTLLSNLLPVLAKNLNQGAQDLGLFEIGRAFFPAGEGELPREGERVAAVAAGRRPDWLSPGEPMDFFDLKGVFERLLSALGATSQVAFEPAPAAPWHPGIGARATLGQGEEKRTAGEVGEVHPAVREAFGIESPCFAFELDLDAVPVPAPAQMAPIPRYPAVTRDLSFFVGESVPAARVREVIEACGESLVDAIGILEDYRDPDVVPAGQKGMLWSITYRSLERTLTDEEVDTVHERIASHVLTELGAARR